MLNSREHAPPVVQPLLEAVAYGGDLKQAVRESVHRLGFEWFGWRLCNPIPGGFDTDQNLLDGGPDGWADLYRASNFREIDPRYREAANSALPHVWDQTTYSGAPSSEELFEASAAHGMGHGVHLATSWLALPYVDYFIVAGSERVLTNARRKSIGKALPDLWAIACYGRKLVSRRPRQPSRRFPRLTPREMECLTLAAKGMTARAIAVELDLSAYTVTSHLARVIQKFRAKNRAEAIARAIAEGTIVL